MLNIQINESTSANMLRAIRAACNELLGETVELRLPTAAVESLADQEQAAQEAAPQPEPAVDTSDEHPAHPQPAEELDSAGQLWNAELHASTKSKNADGTWKKRRNAGSNQVAQAQEAAGTVDTVDVSTIQDQPGSVIKVGLGAVPPVPPAPTPTAEPIMPKIFALITSQIVTINHAVEAAQAEGYADLGANGLGGAPAEKQLAVLRKLEGE